MKQLNWYQIFGKSNIPDGRTVLPTDDIQILLNCANIWDKTYTTLSELLADADTLLAVISSNNAIDYLVRSTTWAVAQALVPIMTSNTTPSGECFAQSDRTNEEAYKAFDNDNSSLWHSATSSSPFSSYVGYDFQRDIDISFFEMYKRSNYVRSATIKLQISDDGVTWTDCFEYTGTDYTSLTRKYLTTPIKGRKIRLHFSTSNCYASGQNLYWTEINTLQFYSASITADATAMSYIGANNYAANTLLADATWCNAICNSEYFESVLNVKVPLMTSDTAPEGECFGSSPIKSSNYWYKAFDRNNDTYASVTPSTATMYIGYIFPSAVNVVMADFLIRSSTAFTVSPIVVSYSDNGVDYTDNANTFSTTNNVSVRGIIGSNGMHRYWKLTRTVSSLRDDIAHTVQFYGRRDI